MTPKMKFEYVSLAEVAEVSKADVDDVAKERQPLVLVVDDERVIADTLSMILSMSGFSTRTAYDGATALTLAMAESPDLLISDVMMPGMSGIDLAITLTEAIPECKVLLFSGQAATVDLLREARDAGHHFTTLAKPVHPTDMLKRVSESLKIRGVFSEAATDESIRGAYLYQ